MIPAILATWKLTAVSSSTDSGEQNESPFGPNPTGFLTYTPDGRMSAIVSYGGRKRLSSTDSHLAPVEEQAEAFKTFVAYAGRFTLNGDTVIHHVEVCSIQDWVGTDLIRGLKLEGDRLVLVSSPTPVDGKTQTFNLIWQRLPSTRK
jgi:hypothetical protein